MKCCFASVVIFHFTVSLGILIALVPSSSIPELVQNETSTIPIVANAESTLAVTKPIPTFSPDTAETRVESFTDDKRIGRPRNNKIEIRCYNRGAGNRFAEIKFYTRTEYNAWIEVQSFEFEKDGITDCNPVIEDFNNDGFKDFTYVSSVAARGANDVRRLFVYDKERDELVYIKNSEDYPNLAYNPKLNCIDSFMVYGATSTVFLRLKGDELKEFASVSTGEERVVTVTNPAGEQRIVRREKMNPDNFEEIFWRFTFYDPPR